MNKTEVAKLLIYAEKEYGLPETLYRVFGKNVQVRIPFAGSACEASIDELALSVRSHNALGRANVATLGELIERLNEGGLKSIRNLGVKSFSEIQTKMLVYGFERLSEREKYAFFYTLAERNAVLR